MMYILQQSLEYTSVRDLEKDWNEDTGKQIYDEYVTANKLQLDIFFCIINMHKQYQQAYMIIRNNIKALRFPTREDEQSQ